MQNYYYSPTTQPQQMRSYVPSPGLKGRPVSSLEEVRAAAIDFDGSISFFPDLANGRIYTKQCNIDGTASLNMYELKEIPQESPNTEINLSAYVTRDELQETVNKIKEAIIQSRTIIQKQPQTKIETPQTSKVVEPS